MTQARASSDSAAAPVQSAERIQYLDILRGFAVMAIFVVNIKAMAMPFAFYMNPSLWTSELDQLIAVLQRFVIEDKWRTIFNALYGAGLMMMWERLEAAGRTRGILFKRTGWLIVFGAVHLFGLWGGDILFIYGVTGLLAILFMRLKVKTLTIVASVLLIVGTAWVAFFAAGPVFDETLRAELKPLFWLPAQADIDTQTANQLGPVWAQFESRLVEGRDFLLFYFLLGGMLPVTLALMLFGMVLYKSGLLRGQWPVGRVRVLAVTLLAAAWTLDGLQVRALKNSGYDFDVYSLNQWMASLDGYLGGLGYCCLVAVLVAAGWRFQAVAAVGRMAFSNYIACTLIGTTLAVGHGFGLFGTVSLHFLMWVVLGTIVAMLIWSPLWLARFRFGPLEWLWRSLVYGARQPLRRQT